MKTCGPFSRISPSGDILTSVLGATLPTVPSLMRAGMPVASPQFSVWP